MYNNELYQKIENKFGKHTAALYAIIEAYKYELLSQECSSSCNEIFFEKQWWDELVKNNKMALYEHK